MKIEENNVKSPENSTENTPSPNNSTNSPKSDFMNISTNLIRPLDGTFDPNWVTYKIYNIFDILNAPMRGRVMQYAETKMAKKAKKESEQVKSEGQ